MGSTSTPSRRNKYAIKPQEMARTVGELIHEAITNRSPQPHDAPQVTPSSEVFTKNSAILPNASNVTWPMPIERFQYGHFLEPGDIMLSTRLESFFSFLMKTFDNSRFAHSALTFVTPRSYPAVDRSFMLEATFGGIDLNAFSSFVMPAKIQEGKKHKPRYVVGIKRLEAPWFTTDMRPLVGGRMLRFIKDDEYDFALLAALAADRSRILFRLRDFFFGRSPTINEFLSRTKKFKPSEFICSGFVQFAYVDMIRQAVREGLMSPEMAEKARDDVFFASWVTPDSSVEELMAVKPRDLAASERLKWKYLIYAGEVHKVDTEQQVNDFFDKVNGVKK